MSNYANIPRQSPILLPVPGTTVNASPSGCEAAPQEIVDKINEAFTGGEHLEHVQAIEGPHAMTYVSGNIFTAAGVKESSQDTWVVYDGNVYALTSDARKRTTLQDGRDLPEHYNSWPQYNDQVSQCVGIVERAAHAAAPR